MTAYGSAPARTLALGTISLAALAGGASAAACYESLASPTMAPINTILTFLTEIGNPIGYFMFVYMGIKWVLAEGPEDRENARRGVIYICIGILMLRTSLWTVDYLLC
jgi:hypothetical protein